MPAYIRTALGGILLACAGGPLAGELALAGCQLAGPFGLRHVEARCGTLAVPEDPARPDGRHIELNVAVVPADRPARATSLVTLLAGGPGQAATEAYAGQPDAFAELNRERDILLVDQRGTGASHPLDCPLEPEDLWAPEVDAAAVRREASRCLEGLEDTDPRFYTTSIAMDDLDRVRAALGYERLDLVGVSYGTRAAQVYMRRHPDRVRTAALLGVIPMDAAMGLDHARHLDDALDGVFRRCADDQRCNAAFPRAGESMRVLLEQLRASAAKLAFPHPTTGAMVEVPFGALALAGAVRMLAYTPDGQALLPLLVHEARESGRLDNLAAQALMFSDAMIDQLSRGMELSVLCAEDVPFYPPDWQPPAGSAMDSALVDYARWACEVWPRGEAPAGFHDRLRSDLPVLLVSGEHDPVTPPVFAEQAMAGLGNARHLVAPGQGHALLGNACIRDIVSHFVRDAGFDDVENGCLDRLGPMPFFIDYTGPAP